MNSFDYLEVSVKLNPFTEEMAEILTAELSELPFDSFVTEEPFLKCYIQTTDYKASDVKVVLSGYPAVEGFTATPVQGRNWNQAWDDSFQPIVVDGFDKARFYTVEELRDLNFDFDKCCPFPHGKKKFWNRAT